MVTDPRADSPAVPVGPEVSLLERLRVDTRAEHEGVEADLALVDAGLTLERYRARLEQLHGFYLPVEARLARTLAGLPLGLEERRKTPLLRADLEALGGRHVDQLPLCVDLPRLDDRARALGCLYVLEGATLGGRVITRHVRAHLGVTPERGGRFFAGYGDATGARWRAFRAALVELSADCDPGAVVDGAVSTFRALRRWCGRPWPGAVDG